MGKLPDDYWNNISNIADKKICLKCGSVVSPTYCKKGHFLAEVALWSALVVPGVCFSIWRRTNKNERCPVCKSDNVLIPYNSPVGQKLGGITEGGKNSGQGRDPEEGGKNRGIRGI